MPVEQLRSWSHHMDIKRSLPHLQKPPQDPALSQINFSVISPCFITSMRSCASTKMFDIISNILERNSVDEETRSLKKLRGCLPTFG
jgi:hypothetical protein